MRGLRKLGRMHRIKNPWLHRPEYHCFGCAPTNEAGVRMNFYANGSEVVCYWKPEARFQGWVDTLHGGIQSVLLDEICAWAVLNELKTSGVTVKMETRFRKPVSTKDDYLVLRAKVTDVKRNLATIHATLSDSRETCCTEAVCTYFTFTREKAREMGLQSVDYDAEEVDEETVIASLRK